MEHTEGAETPGRARAYSLFSPHHLSLSLLEKKKESQPVTNYGLYNGYFSLSDSALPARVLRLGDVYLAYGQAVNRRYNQDLEDVFGQAT